MSTHCQPHKTNQVALIKMATGESRRILFIYIWLGEFGYLIRLTKSLKTGSSRIAYLCPGLKEKVNFSFQFVIFNDLPAWKNVLLRFVVNFVMSLKKRMELVKRQFRIARSRVLCQFPRFCAMSSRFRRHFNQNVFLLRQLF